MSIDNKSSESIYTENRSIKEYCCRHCHEKFKYKSDLESHLNQNHIKLVVKSKSNQLDTNNKRKRKNNKKNESKIENRLKCNTCHTYRILDGSKQCKWCISHCLGMPWCTNCQQRLCIEDFKYWIKQYCKQDIITYFKCFTTAMFQKQTNAFSNQQFTY